MATRNPFTAADLGNPCRILCFDQASAPALDQSDLIHGVLPAAGLASIHGSTMQLARLFALDLALTIGSGAEAWHGMRVCGGRVVYFGREARSATLRNHVAAFSLEKAPSPHFSLGLLRGEGVPSPEDIPAHPCAIFFEVPSYAPKFALDAESLSDLLGCLVVVVSREKYPWCDVRIRVDEGCAEIDSPERPKIPLHASAVKLGKNHFGEPVMSDVIEEPNVDVEACLRRFDELAEEGKPARADSQAVAWAGYVIADLCG